MSYERDFKGVWIPKEVWLSDALTMQEKLFYVEIDSLDNEQGCFASNSHFAEFFDVSKGRCTQIIKSLESKKLITINLEYKGKQVVRRLIRVVNKLNTPLSNPKHPYLENDEGNNTSLNNTSNNTSKVTTKSSDNYSEGAYNVAHLLLTNILKINPSFKIPNISTWSRDIDKAIRIDKRTTEQLIDCVNWIYSKQGEFWQKNILSGKKLREKFDTMNMQAMKNRGSNFADDVYSTGMTARDMIREQIRKEEDGTQRAIN